MCRGKCNDIIEKVFQHRFHILFYFIFITLLISPLLENFIRARLLLNFFFSGILIAAVFAAGDRKSHPILALLLAIPMLISYCLEDFISSPFLWIFGLCSAILFFFYIIIVIMRYVLKAKNITPEVLFGALVVYMLLGLLWTFLFSLNESLQPGSFSRVGIIEKDNRFAFLYYSFVTLTTLGYGDITPVTHIATSLAVTEAIIGQIYLTVLIARLVGMHIVHSEKRD